MKRMMPCLLILALAALGRADDKEAEAKAKALHDSAARIVALLKGIKDREGAEKAKADLEKAFAAVTQSEEEFRKLPQEQRNRLKETWEPKFTALRADFKKEGERLQKTPGVMAVLADLGPFRQAREAKINQAKAIVLALDRAVQTYKLTTGDFPKNLEVLAESPGDGLKPFVEKAALKDGWGRPIQYDVKGPRNKGIKPDIWSLGPPEEKAALIGNWETKK